MAALIVSRLVSAYAVQNFSSRDDSVSQLRTWLTAQMATLKNEVSASQGKLATFQEQNSILWNGRNQQYHYGPSFAS